MHSRREFIALTGAAIAVGSAGCLGGGQSRSVEGYMVKEMPAPVAGQPDASVTVTLYSDLMCPHCADWHASVWPRLLQNYIVAGSIQFYHRDYPVPADEPLSWDIASAARRVQADAGDKAFYQYSAAVYNQQTDMTAEKAVQIAANIDGTTAERVRDALDREVYYPVVKADRDRGNEAGVPGTPTVFVGGEKFSTDQAPTYDNISAAIDQQLSVGKGITRRCRRLWR